jgi:hypothetical protein
MALSAGRFAAFRWTIPDANALAERVCGDFCKSR